MKSLIALALFAVLALAGVTLAGAAMSAAAALIVASRRGYQGGYVFERDPADITVAELTHAISGYELFAPVPPDRLQPHLPFVEELQRRLHEVASDAFGKTSSAEITTQREAQEAPPPA